MARHLVNHFNKRLHHTFIPAAESESFCWLRPKRRPSKAVLNIGGGNVPVVISSVLKQQADEPETTLKSDFLYLGQSLPTAYKEGRRYIVDFDQYARHQQELADKPVYPIFPVNAMPFIGAVKADAKFLVLQYGAPAEEYIACLKAHPEVAVVGMSMQRNPTGELRALAFEMMNAGLENPLILAGMYKTDVISDFQLDSAADMGVLLIDGLADGVWLMNDGELTAESIEDTAFGILQAARARMSKTEYISCPGCGRTLYDLQTTIARIREATKDLTGVKIGIMGCIVNGPGEMADADYGYVGAGPGKVSLYKGQTCVEHNISEDEAVSHLLALIRKDRGGKAED